MYLFKSCNRDGNKTHKDVLRGKTIKDDGLDNQRAKNFLSVKDLRDIRK